MLLRICVNIVSVKSLNSVPNYDFAFAHMHYISVLFFCIWPALILISFGPSGNLPFNVGVLLPPPMRLCFHLCLSVCLSLYYMHLYSQSNGSNTHNQKQGIIRRS